MDDRKPFLGDPRLSKDQDWAKKIAIAKQAREAGHTVREGKSPVAPQPKLATTK